MGDREDQIIARTKKSLIEDGYVETKIFDRSESGIADYDSYFEMMVDRRLSGQDEPAPQDVWEEMKRQYNNACNVIACASKDYTKLFNANQGLKEIYDDLLKGK